jgi:hypothetical protein
VKSKLALTLILVNFAVLGVWSRPPSLSTSAVEARANAMLKQLSLEEKIEVVAVTYQVENRKRVTKQDRDAMLSGDYFHEKGSFLAP